MSEDPSAKVEAANKALLEAGQALADATDQHVELCVGIYGVIYYAFYHPATCPEHKKQLPAHDDVPDAFRRMFEDGGTTDEPQAE